MATTFTNQATLSYNGAELRSNIAVGVLEDILSVTKSAVTSVYSAGDTITYVVSIVNSSDTALTGLTVTDDLGAYPFGTGAVQPLSYIDGSVQVYANGVLQSDPAVAKADGLTFSGVTVPAQGNTLLIYAAAVNSFAPLDSGSSITNTVAVTGAGISETQARATVSAADAAQPDVVKSVSPIPVAENGRLTYTFQLLNSGNMPVEAAEGAIISDVFDPVLTDLAVTLDGAPLTAADYSYDELTGVFATAAGALSIPAATYAQDPATGEIAVTPGSATLTVTGTV